MNQRRLAQWGVLLIALLATALRLYQLGVKSFWWDECFTYTVAASLPLDVAWQAMIEDANKPPLYYLFMQLWRMLTGTSEYAFRFPSAALGLLTVPIIYRLGRRLGGKAVGIMAALLLAVCPFHIWHSQDARMYMPMACFGLAAMDHFVVLLRGRPRWIPFILWSGLAYLMHYVSVSLIYVQLACLLSRLRQAKLVRHWFLAQAAALAPLVPWLVLVYVVHNLRPTGLGWIPYPGLLAPFRTLGNFGGCGNHHPAGDRSEESSWTIEAMTARYKRVWLVWRSPREYNHRLSKSDPFDVFAEASPPVRAWLAAHQDQVALDLRLPGLSVVRVDRER
jgi:mannosyltransferase